MITTDSQIKSVLRGSLWLRSKERAQCLKDQQYTCQRCGIKRSVAKGRVVKVEVHHKHGVLNWAEIYKILRKYLLCDVENLECLCKECHKKEK